MLRRDYVERGRKGVVPTISAWCTNAPSVSSLRQSTAANIHISINALPICSGVDKVVNATKIKLIATPLSTLGQIMLQTEISRSMCPSQKDDIASKTNPTLMNPVPAPCRSSFQVVIARPHHVVFAPAAWITHCRLQKINAPPSSPARERDNDAGKVAIFSIHSTIG